MAIGVMGGGTAMGGGAMGSNSTIMGIFSSFDVLDSVYNCGSAKKAALKATALGQSKEIEDATWSSLISRVSILRGICGVMSWASSRAGSALAKSSYLFFSLVKGLSGIVSCLRACKALIDLCYYEKQSGEALTKEERIAAKKKAIAACMSFLGDLFLAILVVLELAGLFFSFTVAPWLTITLISVGLGMIFGSIFVPALISSKK